MNAARRASMARPLELAGAARQLRTLPPEVVSTIAVEALARVPVVSLVWQQAAFAVYALGQAEQAALELLTDPEALRRALLAAEAGAPLHPSCYGLGVDDVLAKVGREVHQP